MSDIPREIPKRGAYKAAEVCEAAHIQLYVLRSWESEFPTLGVVRGGVRIYRHGDLEQVLRITQLVFEEGLTLAGARRRIEEDSEPQPELPLEEFVTPEMRQGIGRVKQGLHDLLTMLGGKSAPSEARDVAATSGAHPATPRAPEVPPRKAPRKATRKVTAGGRGKAEGGKRRRIGRA